MFYIGRRVSRFSFVSLILGKKCVTLNLQDDYKSIAKKAIGQHKINKKAQDSTKVGITNIRHLIYKHTKKWLKRKIKYLIINKIKKQLVINMSHRYQEKLSKVSVNKLITKIRRL